jgi:hypothetical protein
VAEGNPGVSFGGLLRDVIWCTRWRVRGRGINWRVSEELQC